MPISQAVKIQAAQILAARFSSLKGDIWGYPLESWIEAAIAESPASRGASWCEGLAPCAHYVSRREVPSNLDIYSREEDETPWEYAAPLLSFGVDLSGRSASLILTFSDLASEEERRQWLEDAESVKTQLDCSGIECKYKIDENGSGIFGFKYQSFLPTAEALHKFMLGEFYRDEYFRPAKPGERHIHVPSLREALGNLRTPCGPSGGHDQKDPEK